MSRSLWGFLTGLNLILVLSATNAASLKGSAPLSDAQMLLLLKQVIDNPNPLIRTLSGIKDDVSTSFEIFVDESSLDRISDDANKLGKVFPSILDPINNPQAIRKFALAGGKGGTLIGGTDELERLQKESDKRAKEIADLRNQRASIQDLADQYKGAVVNAQKISDRTGSLASDPLVEITTLAGGKRLDL